MTKTKSTKRALLLSALSLLMCVSMLIGSTFAWFTDSVTSGNNKIVAGTLDIDLYKVELKDNWFEEFRAGKDIFNNEEITDSEEAIFSEDILWEPGYTEVANLKLVNNGNLALKYQAIIRPTDTVGMLAEVIDVYVADEVITPMGGTREDQIENNMTKVGTLKEVMEGTAIIDGEMKTAGDTQFFSIVLKMQESAGNKYQGQTAGAFDITVLATQLAYESDSFNNQYDKDAVYPVTTVADLMAAISNASTDAANPTVISITSSFEVSEAIQIPAGTYVEINGNGKTISRAEGSTNVSAGSVALAKDTMFYIEGNASITNLTIDAKGNVANRLRGVVVKGNVDLTGCTIKGAYAPDNAGGAVAAVGGTVNLDNCTITGNTASYGAAALGDAAGTVNIKNSTISGNTGTKQGGTSLYGFSGSAINISDSTIADDSALYLVGATPSVTYTISGDVAIDDIYDAYNNASHRVVVNGAAEFHPLPAIKLTSALENELVFYVNEPGAGQLIIRRTLLEGANGYTLTDADLAHVKVYYKDGVTADYTEYDASNATYELVVQDNRIEFVQK